MLKCDKCSGRVFVDRAYPQHLRLELSCLMCGKRWIVKRDEGDAFSKWLYEKEIQYAKSQGISI